MKKRGVKNPALFLRATVNLDLREDILPGSFSLASHGLEVPVGNLFQEVGPSLLRANERNADLHLHRLIARGVEGSVSADLSLIGSSPRTRFDAIISPCAEGAEWAVELGGKVEGIR